MEKVNIQNKNACSFIAKVLLFFGIGIFLFAVIQRLFVPKWNYPRMYENVSYAQETFYGQEKQIDEVILFGTSHMEFGISPMQLYKDCGVTVYNLGLSAERISGTYFLLQQALKTQHPKVVVIDCSALFLQDNDENAWRYILDNMPMGFNKVSMARAYDEFMLKKSGLTNDTDSDRKKANYVLAGIKRLCGILERENIRSALFPMIRYHSRWEELGKTDFRDFYPNNSYFNAGYFLQPIRVSSGYTLERMNELADEYFASTVREDFSYENGSIYRSEENNPLYEVEISEDNKQWLDRIADLCKDNDIQLLLTKIPSICYPNVYPSAWTKKRYDYMKEFSERYGFDYYDFLYDTDIGLNIETDFSDGGGHLNYNGAKKATLALGEYLCSNYALEARENPAFEQTMPVYNLITEAVELELQHDFCTYLQLLKERKNNYLICIAAQDDIRDGLNDEDIQALKALGLEVDFYVRPGHRKSYIAVLDGGEHKYECVSNRKLLYEDIVNFGENNQREGTISIVSSGWNTGALASIKICDQEYAVNQIGMNIVVVDKESGQVIDSVAFNTHDGAPHVCQHSDSLKKLNDYWMALIEKES